MTTLMFLRFFLWTLLELFLITLGTLALVEDVNKNGFHWFKTPFSAAWLMIGYLSIFYRVLNVMVKSDSANQKGTL